MALESTLTELSGEELRWALLEGGLTLRDLARRYGVSREWIRQLAQKKAGIKSAPKERKPSWYAQRMGRPELASKEWLCQELVKAGSVKGLARKLGIGLDTLKTQLARLNIDYRQLLADSSLSWVEVSCRWCGKKIRRPTRNFTVRKYRYSFCNRYCLGKWLGTTSGFKPRVSEADRRFIKHHWQEMTDEEMAEVLGLKKRTLAKTRRALGLLRQQPARWQREELEFLQKNYSRLTQEEIAQQLERSLKAVSVKASQLGLKKRKWQREELEFLQKNYSRLTQEEIAQQLERSLKAVNVKASRLGLKKRRGRPV